MTVWLTAFTKSLLESMEMPHFENLGEGILILDVAPDDGCMGCGHWMWGYALVDANLRVDLLTDKALPFWTAKSDCLKCGITHKWRLTPDKPYPQSHDDPFAK